MASITKLKNGCRKIQFTDLSGVRRAIYCGPISEPDGDDVKRHIESILLASRTHSTIPPRTAEWLINIPDVFYAKLAKSNLVEPRIVPSTLGEFVDSYIAKRVDTKPASRSVFERARHHLIEFFGADRDLTSITEGDAEDYARHLQAKEIGKKEKRRMADATVRKMCGVARQFFRYAMKRRIIASNPFDSSNIKTKVKGNQTSFRFITPEESKSILDACPNAEWRLIFALSRFGGLRCPSEILSLRWEHIDWENDRIVVQQSKVERWGSPQRNVPIFPELRPHLLTVAEEAEPGTKWLITRYRHANSNLRTEFNRIVRKAGLTPWPKLFNNLRKSRQTELTDRFAEHVVCAWMGNSEQVAREHYLHVTEEHFRRATEY